MIVAKNKIDLVLFNELKDECLQYINLLSRFENDNLTDDQAEEILGEMMGFLTHLNAHSGLLKEEIEE